MNSPFLGCLTIIVGSIVAISIIGCIYLIILETCRKKEKKAGEISLVNNIAKNSKKRRKNKWKKNALIQN